METRREARNAMEVTFKVVFFLVTLPTALALQGLPPSLQLSPFFGRTATITVCFGCFLSLVGLLHPQRDKGLPVQRLGLVGVAFGSTFYAVALALGQPDAALILISSIGIGAAVSTSLLVWRLSRARHDRITNLLRRVMYGSAFAVSIFCVYLLSDANGFAMIALAYGMSLSIGFGAVARRVQLRHLVHERVVESQDEPGGV